MKLNNDETFNALLERPLEQDYTKFTIYQSVYAWVAGIRRVGYIKNFYRNANDGKVTYYFSNVATGVNSWVDENNIQARYI